MTGTSMHVPGAPVDERSTLDMLLVGFARGCAVMVLLATPVVWFLATFTIGGPVPRDDYAWASVTLAVMAASLVSGGLALLTVRPRPVGWGIAACAIPVGLTALHAVAEAADAPQDAYDTSTGMSLWTGLSGALFQPWVTFLLFLPVVQLVRIRRHRASRPTGTTR